MRFSIVNHLEQFIPISPVKSMMSWNTYPIRHLIVKYLVLTSEQRNFMGFTAEDLGFDPNDMPESWFTITNPYFIENLMYLIQIAFTLFMGSILYGVVVTGLKQGSSYVYNLKIHRNGGKNMKPTVERSWESVFGIIFGRVSSVEEVS